MGIRLTEGEAWNAIEAAHTGILTTLRFSGRPVTLPVWFVVVDQTVCLSTPPRTKKVSRVRRDSRASFLIESGRSWDSLTGVHLSGDVYEVSSEVRRADVKAALNVKYQNFRVAPTDMPDRVRDAYSQYTILQFVPDGRILSWDNRRIAIGDNA